MSLKGTVIGEVPVEPVQEPAAEPEKTEAPAPAPVKVKKEREPKQKHYVTKTGRMRDPYSQIMYEQARPMPGADTKQSQGWIRVQVAAGVLVEYDIKKAEPRNA